MTEIDMRNEYLKGMKHMLSKLQIRISECKSYDFDKSCGECVLCVEGNKALKEAQERINKINNKGGSK